MPCVDRLDRVKGMLKCSLVRCTVMSEEDKKTLPSEVEDEFMKKAKKSDVAEVAETLEGKIPTKPKEE